MGRAHQFSAGFHGGFGHGFNSGFQRSRQFGFFGNRHGNGVPTFFHAANKAIAEFGNGFDEARLAAVIPQRLADLKNALREGRICDRGILPDLLVQLILGDDFLPLLDKIDKHVKSLLAQIVFVIVLPQAGAQSINLNVFSQVINRFVCGKFHWSPHMRRCRGAGK